MTRTLLLALAASAAGCMQTERVARTGPLPSACPLEMQGVDVDLETLPDGYEIILAKNDQDDLRALERMAPGLFRDFAVTYDYGDRYTLAVDMVLNDDPFEFRLPRLGLGPGATDERLLPEGVRLTIRPRRPADLDLVRQLGRSFADHLDENCGADV